MNMQEQDLYLFPAIWKNSEHYPLIKWGIEASNDPDIHNQWKEQWPDCYLCIACHQSNITVLDVDDKKGKEGSLSLVTLEMEHGDIPPTLAASTPSGGKHYFFKGRSAASVEKLGPGLDTPVMVPYPGSHVQGKGVYTLIQDAALAPLPDWILDKVGQAREKDPDQHIPAVELDQPHNVADAISYLQAAEEAIEGSGGDHHTFITACKVRDYGISEVTCLDLMLKYWNDRCSPPWDYEELNKKISNAYNYAQTRAGENLAQADFFPVLFGADDPDDSPKHISQYQDSPPERIWTLKEWIPSGEITSLYGAGGMGKSLLALQMAMAISAGGSFMGIKVDDPIPTLGVFCEDEDAELHRRLADIRRSAAYDFLNYSQELFLWSRAGKDAVLARADRNKLVPGPFYDKLRKTLDSMGEGRKFLILDTLADLFAGSENDRAMVNYFVKVVLGGLMKNHNATVLLLGHPAKSTDSEYSGSTAWNNAVRSRLTLSAHENENLQDYRILSRSKSNYAKRGENIVIHWNKGCFTQVEEDDIVDEIGETNMAIMLAEIKLQADKGTPYGNHGASKLPINSVEIKGADGKPLSKDTKKSLLNRLVHQGLAEIITGNKYKPNGIFPKEIVEDEG